MNQIEPTVTRISDALRNIVTVIYVDATGQPYEGQCENEIQGLADVLTGVIVLHERIFHDLAHR